MSLDLDTNAARNADSISSTIRETGKYIGIITRAEKLTSEKGTEGLGLSIKTDDGATANYLDVYTIKPTGEKLRGFNIAQAILCCTRTKSAAEGEIHFDRWDKEAKQMIEVAAPGYPSLMGKRIGFLLQKELATNTNTGADTERLNIFGVFEADTELTATEILDKKTQPEQLEKMLQVLMQRPIRDTRQKHQVSHATAAGFDDFDQDIPF
jgi:hypothetical protein